MCVAEPFVDCASDSVQVIPQKPAISIVKTAGDAADGAVFTTEPGAVTYSYVVTNTGPLDLSGIVVTDDNGTPGVPGDDFEATCPDTTLAAGASMTCTSTVDVIVDTTNVAVVHGVTALGNTASDQDDAVVRVLTHGLTIDKSNDAPVDTVDTPGRIDGGPADGPRRVDRRLHPWRTHSQATRSTTASSRDVLPAGVTYVDGLRDQQRRVHLRRLRRRHPDPDMDRRSGHDRRLASATRRPSITGAAALSQPLINTATIKSDADRA